MRNPIRLKNLNLRFLPLYLAGAAILAFQPPAPESVLRALPLILVGALLRSWGAGHLVKNHFLTMSGPYAHLRHPLYLGTILVATGFGVAIGGWLAIGVLLLIWPWFALRYFPRKEAIESRRLTALYGDRFTEYREAVPALWPRLRAWRGSSCVQTGGDQVSWALGRYSDNNELGTLLAIVLGITIFWLRAVSSA